MKTALMVAEKPSLALALAKILSDNTQSKRAGLSNVCPVYEWKGSFRNEPALVMFRMTSVCGHVMSLDFTAKYNSWDKVDPVELFACPTEKHETSDKRIAAHLAHEAKGCDFLVLWLDCDKEGENICFEVIEAVSKQIHSVHSPSVTFRAKFSAITDKDIKHAMRNLSHPNENEARSVDARQEIDLRVGCAFTRFQTKYFQGNYGDLDSSLISYGPCQTPTLGFCVQRYDEIVNFKPENYWFVQLTLVGDSQSEVVFDWYRGRVFKREIANVLLTCVKKYKDATVENISTKEHTKMRPLALNTVELMRAASSGLGIGPQQAMNIAERLYTQGYISYPRTETTSYPPNFDLIGVVKMFRSSNDFGEHASKILATSATMSSQPGTDIGDHPPITPQMLASRNDFDLDTWRVYDYICRHFLATLSTNMRYATTTTRVQIALERFSATTSQLIDPGYTAIMPWQAMTSSELTGSGTAQFRECETLRICNAQLIERQTSAPDFLTESELITLMEKHGVGTDASIPVHINNICQRNYVTVSVSGRKLEPTRLGVTLVHGYRRIDAELVLPTMRAEVEKLLNLIAIGAAEFDAVLRHALDIFQLKFQYFVRNISGMDRLFEESFSPIAESGKAYSRCGKCRRYMKYIESKPVRLHCVLCDDTYSMPTGGTVRAYRDLRCPLDDFELLQFSSGVRGRTYVFCPYCAVNAPFTDMSGVGAASCSSCTHPTCAHSMYTMGVSKCAECANGVLVLDETSAPKKWRLGCNQCDVIVNMFKGAMKCTVDAVNICEECSAQMVTVVYKTESTKFKNGATELTGCVFCTDEFSALVEKHRAVATRGPGSGRGGNSSSRPSRNGVTKGAVTQNGRGGGRNGRGCPSQDKMAQLASYFL